MLLGKAVARSARSGLPSCAESLSTLKFANRAKCIRNLPKVSGHATLRVGSSFGPPQANQALTLHTAAQHHLHTAPVCKRPASKSL